MAQLGSAATSRSLCHQCKQWVNSNQLKVHLPSLFVSPSDTERTINGHPCLITVTAIARSQRCVRCYSKYQEQIRMFKERGGMVLVAAAPEYIEFMQHYPSVKSQYKLGCGTDAQGWPSLFTGDEARANPFTMGQHRELKVQRDCPDVSLPAKRRKVNHTDNKVDQDEDDSKYDSNGGRYSVEEWDVVIEWCKVRRVGANVNKAEYFRVHGLSEWMKQKEWSYRNPRSYAKRWDDMEKNGNQDYLWTGFDVNAKKVYGKWLKYLDLYKKQQKKYLSVSESGKEAQDTVQNGLWNKRNKEYGVNRKQAEKIESVCVQTKKRNEIELERLECAKSTVQSIDKMAEAVGLMASNMVSKGKSESYRYGKLLSFTRKMGLEAKAHRVLMVKIKANKEEFMSTWEVLEEDEVTEKEKKKQLIQLANSIYLPSKK